MTRTVQAFVVPPGAGKTIRGPAGGPSTIKAHTENTAGSFALLEVEVGPKQGPPLHLHRREDEMWYILEGRFRFIADGEVLLADAGAFVFVPRMTEHCFQNIGDEPGRVLVMFAPSGMERFFEEHAGLPAGPAEAGAYLEIARRNWMEVAGPTLGESHPL